MKLADNRQSRDVFAAGVTTTATETSLYIGCTAHDASAESEDMLDMTVARETTTTAVQSPVKQVARTRLSRSRLVVWLWPFTIVVSALAVNLVVVADSQSVVRPLLVMWFLLICPGMAFIRLLRLRSLAVELSLATALSVALDTMVAGALLYSGAWSPTAGMIALGAISTVGAAAQIVLIHLSAHESEAGL